jgi:hypothetical protein
VLHRHRLEVDEEPPFPVPRFHHDARLLRRDSHSSPRIPLAAPRQLHQVLQHPLAAATALEPREDPEVAVYHADGTRRPAFSADNPEAARPGSPLDGHRESFQRHRRGGLVENKRGAAGVFDSPVEGTTGAASKVEGGGLARDIDVALPRAVHVVPAAVAGAGLVHAGLRHAAAASQHVLSEQDDDGSEVGHAGAEIAAGSAGRADPEQEHAESTCGPQPVRQDDCLAPPCLGLAYDEVRVRAAAPRRVPVPVPEEEEAVVAVDGLPGAGDFREEVEGEGLADGDSRHWRRHEDRRVAAVEVEAHQDAGHAQEAEAG